MIPSYLGAGRRCRSNLKTMEEERETCDGWRIVHPSELVEVGGRGEFCGRRSAHRWDGGGWDIITEPNWLGIM